MDDAKLPPPKPHSSARTRKIQYGEAAFCTAKPMPMAGISNDHVVNVVQSRPPNIAGMKA
jgi:hypothetical protein